MSIWRRRKLARPHVPRSIDHSTFKERCNFIKFNLHLEVLSWPFNKMGKRYYCDYCDKTFADNSQNRKKHLNGVVHDRLRKLHYSLFRGTVGISSACGHRVGRVSSGVAWCGVSCPFLQSPTCMHVATSAVSRSSLV